MPTDEQIKNEIRALVGEIADYCWQAEKKHGLRQGKRLSSKTHELRAVMIDVVDENIRLRQEIAKLKRKKTDAEG